jgi:hypothetical protein
MELTLPDELFDRLQRLGLPKIFICSWGGTSAETYRTAMGLGLLSGVFIRRQRACRFAEIGIDE